MKIVLQVLLIQENCFHWLKNKMMSTSDDVPLIKFEQNSVMINAVNKQKNALNWTS